MFVSIVRNNAETKGLITTGIRKCYCKVGLFVFFIGVRVLKITVNFLVVSAKIKVGFIPVALMSFPFMAKASWFQSATKISVPAGNVYVFVAPD